MAQSSSKDIRQNVTNDGHLDNQESNLLTNNYAENEINWSQKSSFSDSKIPKSELTTNQASFVPSQKRQSDILKVIYDLPIGRKTQLFPLLTLISLAGVVGFGSIALIGGLRTQLIDQTKSELAITELNYNTKIDQMEFGFRGQSENAAIIEVAEAHAEGAPLNPKLRTQVKEILQNEIQTRDIEYATLVDKNLRIIINANTNRSGETFDPNKLVSRVFQEPQQIASTEIVSWSELTKESPPLPEGFTEQDAVIRYTVTPVSDPDTGEAIAALVSGDIVNGKLPIVKKTVDAFFGEGYSAVYLRKPTGEFALATSIDKTSSQEAKVNIPLANTSVLAEAVEAGGEIVNSRLPIGNRTYTVAAKALSNSAGEPVAILAFGDPEIAIGQIIRRSLLTQISLSVLVLIIVVVVAVTLGRLIAEPLKKLQDITQEFSQGNYQLRADVLTTDETGQLASTFNEMADNIEANVEEIRQKENLVRQKAEQEAAARQTAESLAEEQRRLQEEQRQLKEETPTTCFGTADGSRPHQPGRSYHPSEGD